MTTQWMFISPRSKADYEGQGHKIGINSTGMIGLLLTKSQEELEFVGKKGPIIILSEVGIPWP
jgi:ATP adenylyltransferase/5',5'''-P-1,P-4-tetraphosphate phosphorylase II